eukprot:5099191-Alexandrium_andersonii.AAC.1
MGAPTREQKDGGKCHGMRGAIEPARGRRATPQEAILHGRASCPKAERLAQWARRPRGEESAGARERRGRGGREGRRRMGERPRAA